MTLSASRSQTISTPNYPRQYRNNRCVWLITAPAGYLVEVMFPRFDIRSKHTSTCSHYVEIRDNVLGQRGDL